MKKQINPTIKAHLIRGAFYLLLLLAVCAIPFALARRNTADREDVADGVQPEFCSYSRSCAGECLSQLRCRSCQTLKESEKDSLLRSY